MSVIWTLLTLASLLTVALLCAFVPAALRRGAPGRPVRSAPRPCACTDGDRNQPLAGCPHCRGQGRVR